MILNVARRVLHNGHDAEDVFQATFLVLLRKAPTLCWQQSVGNWLYEVAYRLALKAKTAAARRSLHEAQASSARASDMPPDLTWRELQTLLDEELHRLPVSFRVPLILCYLEGSTRDEAAQRLGWSLSTLKRRLERGRELLRLRLVRRGLTVSAALLAPMLMQNTAQATLGPSLVHATVRTALQWEAGRALAELVSAPIAALVKGGLRTMFLTKLKVVMTMLVAAGVFAGAGALARQGLSEKPAALPASGVSSLKNAKEYLVAKPEPTTSNPNSAQSVQISGRVLDPEGKPVAGAKLYLLDRASETSEPSVRAVTKADGRFQFQVTKPKENDPDSGRWRLASAIVAVAQGFGPDWVPLGKEDGSELTLHLVRPAHRFAAGFSTWKDNPSPELPLASTALKRHRKRT